MFDWTDYGWIDYKQEQPEKTGDYLCTLQYPSGSIAEAVGLIIILSWSSRGRLQGWYGRGNKPHKGPPVTYWRPLPDVPEENDDEQIG